MAGFDASRFKWEDTVLETLDIRYVEFTPERVVATMPVTPRVHQPFGILHGGVNLVLAESVASAGSYQFIDYETQRAVGLEINANHLRSVAQGMIRAVGIPVHIGRRTIIWEIKIYDEQDNLTCVSRCTMSVIALEKPAAE